MRHRWGNYSGDGVQPLLQILHGLIGISPNMRYIRNIIMDGGEDYGLKVCKTWWRKAFEEGRDAI